MELLRAAATPLTPEELVAGLDLAGGGREGLPRVVAIMIASVDGRATVDGRSVALGHPEDRRLLRGLRAAADAVLAGTGTLEAEGYATLLDPDQQAERVAAGRSAHPVVTTVSRSGDVPWDVPVFFEEGVPKAVYLAEPAAPPADATDTWVTALGEGFALRDVLAHLHAEHDVASVACEGGPGLLRALVAEDLVDDLLLTLAPLLVGGDGPTSLTGDQLDGPPRMRLVQLGRADDHLFLHYAR